MPRKTPACGTPGGYDKHRYDGTEPCRPCRDAHNAYQRDLRVRKPDSAARRNALHAAHERAVWRLANEYPERYRELVREEIERGGVYRKPEGSGL